MGNVSNYNIETLERERKFLEYRGQGWEKEFLEYRRKWDDNPKEQIVGEFPLDVLIEPSSICNLKCPMCFTNSEDFSKIHGKGFMEFSLYKKIIDEIGGKVPSVRLAGAGEATLHPEFVKLVSYAKEHGIKEVSLVTNGSQLTESFFEEILVAGLDWISISIDGTYSDYEKIRYPLKFIDTLNRLKNMSHIKKKLNVNKPVIQVQGIWDSAMKNIEKYYDILAPYADIVRMQTLIDYEKNSYEWDESSKCQEIYQRLYIAYDGKAYPCCSGGAEIDTFYRQGVIGDTKSMLIKDIWLGTPLEKLREKQSSKDVSSRHTGFCKGCVALRKVNIKQHVVLHGRKIAVTEYI